MQYTVNSAAGLEQVIQVTVPAAVVAKKVDDKLTSWAKKARVDGFRPGKVPVRVVKQRYGASIRHESLQEIIQESINQIVNEVEFQLAGRPEVEVKQDDPHADLTFEARCELLPEISTCDLSQITFDKTEVEITSDDVANMMDKLRAQHAQWIDKDEPAELGDRACIDFVGRKDGVPFDGGQGRDVSIVLGDGTMLPDFDQAIHGMEVGTEKEFPLVFPQDYGVQELAGQAVSFQVQLKQLSRAQLPELDSDFIVKFGHHDGDMAAFKQAVQDNMRRELDAKLRSRLQDHVLERVLAQQAIELPQVMVRAELEFLQTELKQSKPHEQLLDLAKKRVKTTLFFAHYVREQGIEVDQAQLKRRVFELAQTYEDPSQVETWIYNDKKILANLESSVLEGQIVDHILSQGQVSVMKLSYNDIMGK